MKAKKVNVMYIFNRINESFRCSNFKEAQHKFAYKYILSRNKYFLAKFTLRIFIEFNDRRTKSSLSLSIASCLVKPP